MVPLQVLYDTNAKHENMEWSYTLQIVLRQYIVELHVFTVAVFDWEGALICLSK